MGEWVCVWDFKFLLLLFSFSFSFSFSFWPLPHQSGAKPCQWFLCLCRESKKIYLWFWHFVLEIAEYRSYWLLKEYLVFKIHHDQILERRMQLNQPHAAQVKFSWTKINYLLDKIFLAFSPLTSNLRYKEWSKKN